MKKLVAPALVSVFVLSLALGVTASAAPGAQKPGDIEMVKFVHHVNPESDSNPPPTFNDQYRLMHGGKVKWYVDMPISAVIANDFSDGEATEIVESLTTWDDASGWDVSTSEGDVDGSVEDGTNAISWGDFDSDVIGVTYIWYYPNTGEIVEVGTELNQNLDWSTTESSVSGEMDVRNIMTHEVGHWIVLEDLYGKTAREVTMYGYSDYGEIKKISLEDGDIAGAQDLYGEE